MGGSQAQRSCGSRRAGLRPPCVVRRRGEQRRRRDADGCAHDADGLDADVDRSNDDHGGDDDRVDADAYAEHPVA